VITNVYRKYLEINSVKELIISQKPNNFCNIDLINPPDFQLNKFLYKQIGRKHRWIDRLVWENDKWIQYVNNPNVKTYILKENDELIGYFELIFNKNTSNCEIAYFGILENYIGKKYGGYLLSEAIKNSFENGIKRVWVHTCSLDHKNALNNYESRGMKIFKKESVLVNID